MANASVMTVGNAQIKLDAVSAALVDGAIKSLGVKVEEDAPVNARVKALGLYLTDKIDADALCTCPRCGAPNDALDPKCPFCGNVDADGEILASVEGADPMTGASPPPSSSAKAVEVSPEPAAKPKRGRPPGSKSKKPEANGANGHAARTTEKPNAAELVVADEAKLDDAVKSVLQLKSDWHGNGYRLGKEIGDLFASGLWKSRGASAGKVAYKRFEEFSVKELGMTSVQAKKFSDVSARFTEKQFRDAGIEKLHYILAAPKDAQEALAADAPAQTSEQVKARAAKAVEEYEEEHGEAPARTRGARIQEQDRKPKKGERAVAAPEKTEVTVALVLKKGLKLHLFEDGKSDQPATLASFSPSKKRKGISVEGTVDLNNKVRLFGIVKEADDGQLFVVLKPKRIA